MRICAWILTTVLCISLFCSTAFSAAGANSTLSQEEYYAKELGLSRSELTQLKMAIFQAAINYETYCDVSGFDIPYNSTTAGIVRDIVYEGHPEVFHIRNLSFSYRKGDTNMFTRINFPLYKYDQEEYTRRIEACRKVAANLVADIAGSSLSDVEKALLLHDRLAVWCEYDYKNYQLGNVPDDCYTLYGALVNRVAVCEGYVQAYIYLLDMVGIESYMCTSLAMGHAWNIVLIDGESYHVDVTWDDPVEDITGRVKHTNFLRSTAGITETGHNTSDYDMSPSSTTYDQAFWQNSQSAFQLLGGKIYYIDNEAETLLLWKGDQKQELCQVDDVWRAGSNAIWPRNYARLGSDEAYLYYTLSDAVYRYDPATGEIASAYKPPLAEMYFGIYGFKVEGDYFYCDMYNSPNFTLATKEEYQIKYLYRRAKVQSISISRAPNKSIYSIGEELDTAGLQLTVTYTSGITETVKDGFTVSGYDATVEGKQTVTVTCQGATTTFTVQVKSALSDNEDKGDVDGDGSITSTDARLTLQLYAGKIQGDVINVLAADVDSDGTITSTDARLILQYYAGKITAWP